MPIYYKDVVVVITFTLEIHRETIFPPEMLRNASTREVAKASKAFIHIRVDINIERKLQDNEQDMHVSDN